MTKKPREECREVHYEGRVQGVGFRFRTKAIADRYRVFGFVRNLSDGRVQLVVEGETSEINCFLADVDSEMRGNIHHSNVIVRTVTGEFDGFSIRS